MVLISGGKEGVDKFLCEEVSWHKSLRSGSHNVNILANMHSVSSQVWGVVLGENEPGVADVVNPIVTKPPVPEV